jgi:hypothetical protein
MSEIIYVDENGKPILGMKAIKLKAEDTARNVKENGRALVEFCLQNREVTIAAATILASGIFEVINAARMIRKR